MPENNNPPGKNNATASLVLGIIAVIFGFSATPPSSPSSWALWA